MKALVALLALLGTVSAFENIFNRYLDLEEEVYSWERIQKNEFTTMWGSNVLWLRVQSLVWNNPENVWVQNRNGSTTTWEHDVAIFVPQNLKDSDTALSMLVGGRNNRGESHEANLNDADFKQADLIA